MKKQLMALFVGVCAYVLLAPTALATSNAARARDIVTELRQGDVSPEWSADLLKNSTSIETLYTLAQHFDAQEVAQTTDIHEDILVYIQALYNVLGKDAEAVRTVLFKEQAPLAPTGGRAQALQILSALQRAGVSADWAADISAHEREIEQMLALAKQYTPQELNEVTREERIAMMAYFKSYYELNGFYEQELELVLAQKDIPGYDNVLHTPSVHNGTAMQPSITNVKPLVPASEPLQTQHALNMEGFVNTVVAVVLCVGIFAVLVLLLKRHDEKRHRRI